MNEIINNNNIYQRHFYKTIMTIAFSIDTGHRFHSILRLFVYLFLLNWSVLVSNKLIINNKNPDR